MLRDDCSRTSRVLLLKLWILSQIFLRRKRAFTGWFYRVASSPSETSSWRCCHLCPQWSALPGTAPSSPSSFPWQSRAGRPGTRGPCLHVPHRTAEGADRQALAGWSQITKGKKKKNMLLFIYRDPCEGERRIISFMCLLAFTFDQNNVQMHEISRLN